MNVFISYGNAQEQVTALRLQALAAVNGLTVYVPPAHTRLFPFTSLDSEVSQKLQETEFVLGIVGFNDSPACRAELNQARAVGKRMMLMTELAAAPYFAHLSDDLVVINPVNPYEAELKIVDHLKRLSTGKQANKALVALGTLALGLMIFTLAASED